MWRSTNLLNVLLLAAVVICALSVVTSQHKARKLYVELQEQKELSHQMDVEWGQLQLEQRTFSTPAQVEKIAVQQLQMQPINGHIRYIQLDQPLPPSFDVTSPAKNAGQVIGYSHSAKPPENGSQVAGYLPQARNETVGHSPPGIRN